MTYQRQKKIYRPTSFKYVWDLAWFKIKSVPDNTILFFILTWYKSCFFDVTYRDYNRKKSIWIIQYCITEPIHVSCRISDACLNLLVVFYDHVLLELFIAQHCGYCRPPLRSVFVCCPCLVCVFTWEIGKSFCHDFKLIRIFSDLLFGGLWGPMRPRSVENSSNR